jgi:two-component system cell cycle sensor histidine kinase/response regulator CckA
VLWKRAWERTGRRIDLLDCPVRFRKTGNRIVIGSISPIREGPSRVSGAVIAFRDVTTDRTVETQYRQVRHREALQRLAGGVAHNLNSVLAVIAGYTESLIRSFDARDPRYRDVKMIESAEERAGALTRQLIAFSRQQTAQPALLDLNEQIVSLQQVLKPSAGPQVQIELKLEPELGKVEADPLQLEQIIVALVLNARDAMPNGGVLTVSTARDHLDNAAVSKFADVLPGDYAVLRISDTGVGIEFENQAQVFEPFFTTKERQKGAGLGLAAVYGLVKQNGGHIWFESEPGHGTVFSIYFPRRSEPQVLDGQESSPQELSPNVRGGTETIVVVDDHLLSRQFVSEALRCLGYRVLEARNGAEAINICEQTSENIHLIVSDVMLPNMTGFELASRLSSIRGGLKLLFTSSFSPYALKHHGAVREDTPLLQKPFTVPTLASRVRETLDT